MLEDYVPVVKYSGLNTAKDVSFTGSTCALPAGTTIGGSAVVALATITSEDANALTVGRQGTTGPAFNVDASTALQADGVGVTGLAAGNGAKIATITTGTNAPLTINAAGSGTITIGGTSTGAVILPAAVTVASAGVVSGAGTGANGVTLKNLKNLAASALSGTKLVVQIDIGGTPYYFEVYPTKA